MDVDVRIERMGTGGVGVGALPDGRVIFVPRTAPGDLATVRVLREKKRFATGLLVDLLEVSPERTPPPCPRYGECGGCSLQHIRYPEQLRWKGRIVGDALRRVGGLSVDDPDVTPSPAQTGYRNRVTVTLRRLRGGGVVAGFRQLGQPSRVLDLDGDCLLADRDLSDCWTSLRAHWGPGAKRLPAGGELRLTLRKDLDGVSLVLHGGQGPGSPDALMERVSGLVSIWKRSPNGPAKCLAGKPALSIPAGPSALEVDGDVFTQVNEEAGGLLQNHVLEWIGDASGLRMVDAYCGPGTWGRTVAGRGGTVVGIDLRPGRSDDPGEDASGSFRVVAGRVEDHLERNLPADLVVLNPPREGLHPSIPTALEDHPPPRLIYVSCDPATLARDLGRLREGYTLRDLRSFDLFPQTGHVETVACLEHGSKDSLRGQRPPEGQEGPTI